MSVTGVWLRINICNCASRGGKKRGSAPRASTGHRMSAKKMEWYSPRVTFAPTTLVILRKTYRLRKIPPDVRPVTGEHEKDERSRNGTKAMSLRTRTFPKVPFLSRYLGPKWEHVSDNNNYFLLFDRTEVVRVGAVVPQLFFEPILSSARYSRLNLHQIILMSIPKKWIKHYRFCNLQLQLVLACNRV